MKVMVIGAYGLIGSAIACRLANAGYDVTGVGRSLSSARRRMPKVNWIEGDLAKDTDPLTWQSRLAGVDAVVHAAGLLQDGAGDDVRAVQVDGTGALYEACERMRIRRVIHISAIGAEADADTSFMTTKAEADAALQRRDLDWAILRPGLVLAHQAYGGTALMRGLAAVPGCVPVVAGSGPVQVVAVDDVASTVLALLQPDAPRTGVWDIAHPKQHRLEDIALALRGWLGLAPAPVLHVPDIFIRMTAALGDAAAWLGWRNPLRRTALKQIEAGVVGDSADWMRDFAIEPASLEDIFNAVPATVQDVWHARLLFLKPVVLVTLVMFWLLTGLITLGPAYAEGIARFDATGFGKLGPVLTVAGAFADILLAVLLAWRRTAALALALMMLVSVAYLLIGTLLMPALWIDPLGPLLKIFPVMTLTAVAAAVLPSR